MLTYGIPPEFRGGVHMKPPYAIGSVPSLSGHAVAYRWRSLPRVRRHRASKPQGSSERVLPWQITMDQLIFASLSHTHYWYEVGMLKVPAVYNWAWLRPEHSNTSLNNNLGIYQLEFMVLREYRMGDRHEDVTRPTWSLSDRPMIFPLFFWPTRDHRPLVISLRSRIICVS